MTVLMHDAGGPRREVTVEYVADYLIPAAKENGYTFVSLPAANTELSNANSPVVPSWMDEAAVFSTMSLYYWPTVVLDWAFVGTVVLAFGFALTNMILAVTRRVRQRHRDWEPAGRPAVPVTVLLAAFNEERVIERTIRSVLASHYPILEVIVVDDGSTDLTAAIVMGLSREDSRVRLLQQANSGKSTALNHGIANTRGEVVVTIDADTLVVTDTVGNLVRRFVHDDVGDLGVVAGVVRVGNRKANILTRWQGLEYVTQIGIDRAAQAMLGAITIVPGACAAWRRSALDAIGGFRTDTLAEDADLAMTMHRAGWRVDQDEEAYAFTEAPETLDDLIKQRIRWTYGILQAMWKHRGLLFNPRHAGIGFYVFPNYVVSLLVPFVLLPLTIVMTIVALHTGGPGLLAVAFGLFIVYQSVISAVAVTLMKESPRHLLMVPLYRVIFEPLRAYLLYSTIHAALKGTRVRWNRVTRTGTVDEVVAEETPDFVPPELEIAHLASREPASAGAGS